MVTLTPDTALANGLLWMLLKDRYYGFARVAKVPSHEEWPAWARCNVSWKRRPIEGA